MSVYRTIGPLVKPLILIFTACIGIYYEGQDFVMKLKVYGITLVKHKLPRKCLSALMICVYVCFFVSSPIYSNNYYYRDQPWFSVFKHSMDHEEGV